MKAGRKAMSIMAAVVLCATAGRAMAQSYALEPGDTVEMWGMMEDLATLTIEQHNVTGDTLRLKWEKVSESVPQGWEASNCDNAICNTTLVDSGAMNPVYAGEYGLMLLHVTPHVNEGTAVIRYAVWDMAMPEQRDTLTYILHVDGTMGTASGGPQEPWRPYPNPATDAIRLRETDNGPVWVELMDTGGRTVLRTVVDGTCKIDVGHVERGTYRLKTQGKGPVRMTQLIITQ